MTERLAGLGTRGAVAFDIVLIAALGASASLAHIWWYRLFETSVAADVGGSVLVGCLFALGSGGALCLPRLRGPDRFERCARGAAIGFVAGFALHASQAPAFTPFGLSPAGVNRVLFLGGVGMGLWVIGDRRRRMARAETRSGPDP